MTSEQQVLLNAIQGIVEQAVAPLTERMDGLTERMDGLTERMDGLTERMDSLDARVAGLEERVETIDTRTNQIATDLLDLRDRVPLLEERVDHGFRALKSDLNFAFSDARIAITGQRTNDKAFDALRQEIVGIQQRLSALENKRSGT
jgi:chromosome segregation ATPase